MNVGDGSLNSFVILLFYEIKQFKKNYFHLALQPAEQSESESKKCLRKTILSAKVCKCQPKKVIDFLPPFFL